MGFWKQRRALASCLSDFTQQVTSDLIVGAFLGSGNDYYKSVFNGSRIPAFEEYFQCILSGAMQRKRVYIGRIEVKYACLTLGDYFTWKRQNF